MRPLLLSRFALILCLAGPLGLTAQEPVPAFHGRRLDSALLLPAGKFASAADGSGQTGFTSFLNISSRETVRQFFNAVYPASENVPMDWSGSYVTGTPGTNSTEYLRAVLRRVNFFRALAGVPSGIQFSNEYTRKAQAAALMMGGNNDINHFPPTNWLYYTADGAEAARNSNLSLGEAGAEAVTGQLQDNGDFNAAAGHRRWLLYPQTQWMGSGNVPPTGTNEAADVLWVIDSHFNDPRPATRQVYVSWPPPGYVPYQLVFARWSFSYPNATFGSATVSMTSNGVPVSVFKEAPSTGAGENTLVWVPAGLDPNTFDSFSKPATDAVYHVAISNVSIGGGTQAFGYDVRVFDPSVAGPDHFPVQVIGPPQPYVNASNVYQLTSVTNAVGYEWRQSLLSSSTFLDGAENELTNFVVDAATNLYSVRDASVKYAGSYSFHLAHPDAVSQTLTLKPIFYAATNSAIQMQSRLGYATSVQVARIQVSTDSGGSWSDVYAQAGTGGSGEQSFTFRALSLAAYAGQTVMLRLNFDIALGSYYPQTNAGVGWYIDNLAVTNARQLVASSIASATFTNSFSFSPASAAAYLLDARPVLFGDYRGEWGPGLVVNAITNPVAAVRITAISKVDPTTWYIDFTVLSGSPGGFELWSSGAIPGGFTKEADATIQTIAAGSRYRAVVSSGTAQKFFLINVF